ncbi:MAG: LamG-like jellyroll fold domain-containing protein [Bacteroidales bacterium]|nr:hypothetical protein [Bacteroidales bacterium]MDD2264489.1 hypothetical protein [Bacteroidales bacterium]MDD2831724.1 hypothetical protein [Bacteroidales bacterium]MDD3208951.1 hypothetical protein [Bacteroidales bacterium]MDD3697677.1 hypothetical protein [Bacteroidales bacterium]
MHTFHFLKTVATTLIVLCSGVFIMSCDQTGTTTTFAGTVTDAESGIPLKGVSVSIMPFNLGEETGPDGKYSIELPRTSENVYLVFSIPGYDSWETEYMSLSPKKKNLYTINAQLKQRIAKAVLSSQEVDFGAVQNSVAIQLSNPGSDTLRWNFLELYFPRWLQVEPSNGVLNMGQSQTLTFTCDRSGLPIGEQNAGVQLLGGQAPLTIQVRLLVEGALLKAEGTLFDFGEEETQVSTILSNQGNIPLEWHLGEEMPVWLEWDPAQGNIPAGAQTKVLIKVDRSVLDYGTHTFSTRLLSSGGDTTYFFSISKTQDLIQLSAQFLDFGTKDIQRTVKVSRLSGIHPVSFTVSCQDPNISLSVAQGTITLEEPECTILVTLDRKNIPPGSSESVIRIFAPEQEFSIKVNYATAAVPAEVTTVGFELDDSYRLYLKGILQSNGGGSVIRHGHCWGTMPEPCLENASYSDLGTIAEGRTFVTYPQPLPENGTTWYYRSYATTEMGTFYGQTMEFLYEPPILDDPLIDYNDFANTLTFRERKAGGLPFTEHGFLWNTTGTDPKPGKDNEIRLGPKNSGSFFFYNLSDPQRGVEYYMRSFGINQFGIALSETTSYYLDILKPTPETGVAAEISYYSAVLHGNIAVLGSEKILSYGHCWSTDPIPTIEDDKTDLGTAQNTGVYTSNAAGLLINTPYYYRAYIKTAKGVYYGEQMEFSTLKDESVVVQDGLRLYITTDQTPKAYDWTGRMSDITISNGVTYNRNNKPEGTHAAISFNGSSGYLLSRNVNPLSGKNRGTINFWLRFRQTMNKSLVYPFFGSISEGGFYVEIRHNGTAWVLTLCMGPGKDTYSIPLPSLGGIDISTMLGTAWHMMSIVSNGTSMTIYLDGVNLYIQDMQMAFGIQDDFVVGANALNGTTLNTFLPADMACLRFYDRVLTGQEITQIFNTGM